MFFLPNTFFPNSRQILGRIQPPHPTWYLLAPPDLKHTVLSGGHWEVNSGSTLFRVFKDVVLHRGIEEVSVVVLIGASRLRVSMRVFGVGGTEGEEVCVCVGGDLL